MTHDPKLWWLSLLKGSHVNLTVMEKEDLPLYLEWMNSPEVIGDFVPFSLHSKSELEKKYEARGPEDGWYFIEEKDGTRIGVVIHFLSGTCFEIGYFVIPSKRRKGHCTEAIKMIVDYLFHSREIVRIQACVDVRNLASKKVLQKVGFKQEGTIRKAGFVWGEWSDRFLYSIIREDWRER
ncbi:MAG: GNAT family N-acetyltransferase [Candidatus Thorarchaeota archaeon]